MITLVNENIGMLYFHTMTSSHSFFGAFTLSLAVNSLPLVLKLLCVTHASLSPSLSCSKMDEVHFKLFYHGEVKTPPLAAHTIPPQHVIQK